MKINNLYLQEPPLDILPVNITDVSIEWVMGNAFYVIVFTKTENPPTINYEVLKEEI